MKWVIPLTLIISTFAEAQVRHPEGRRRFDPSHIRGRGSWVCSAQGMNSERPVLSRARSKVEAEAEAVMECKDVSNISNGWFCDKKECEQDTGPRGDVEVRVTIQRGNARIEVDMGEDSKFLCKASAFGKDYYARARTRLEAKILASNICADDRNGNAFFCDVENRDCQEIVRPRRDGQPVIDIFGAFGGRSERDRSRINDDERNGDHDRDDRRDDRRSPSPSVRRN